jgi:hypothetical protein
MLDIIVSDYAPKIEEKPDFIGNRTGPKASNSSAAIP